MDAPLSGMTPHYACPTCGRPYLTQQTIQRIPFRCPICNDQGSGFFGPFSSGTNSGEQVCPKCNRVIWG